MVIEGKVESDRGLGLVRMQETFPSGACNCA